VGVKSTFEGIDVPGVLSYKDCVVDRLWKGLQSTIASRKIDTIEGSGGWNRRTRGPGRRHRLRGRAHRAGQRIAAESLPGLEIDGERVITSTTRWCWTGSPLRWSSSAAA
jgi:dihydrolipoamide dehydrogenase